ncbi:hypothetical protein DF030_05975 [Burkholderia cenocepacia]|nr:hypothetical protein DF030_05975 [Burkholderia cenocepacia]
MTGHKEYSFHRLAAFAYAGCRSTAGRLCGRFRARRIHLDILAENPCDASPCRHTSAGRCTGNPVAAAFRDDDSRQEQVT